MALFITPAGAFAQSRDARGTASSANAARTAGDLFADDVIVPAPGIGFAEGKAAAIAALRRDTLNATSRASWAPIRAGVSADGTHGFTIGFVDVTRANGAHVAGKYLAYWITGAAGWRAAVYRRAPRSSGAVDSATLAPLLPTAPLPMVNDALRIAQDRASLAKAEADFSALAPELGLGPAFARFGDPQAMHLRERAGVEQSGHLGRGPSHYHRAERRLRREHRLHTHQGAGPGRCGTYSLSVLHCLASRGRRLTLALHRGVRPTRGAMRAKRVV